jgi:hypothetical protein
MIHSGVWYLFWLIVTRAKTRGILLAFATSLMACGGSRSSSGGSGATATGGSSPGGASSVASGGAIATGGSSFGGETSVTTGGARAAGGATTATGGDGSTGGAAAGGATTGPSAAGGTSNLGGASGTFLHPGLLHTQADFDRMRAKVSAKAAPWIDSYNLLVANSHASLSYTPNPQSQIHRNDGTNPDNYMTFVNDVAAAYASALRWKITDETNYADKAIQILNAWSLTLTAITWADGYYDGSLVAGIQGYQIANAAEIMRTYSGWAAADFARFRDMMRNVFLPMVNGIMTKPSSVFVYSNWDLCSMDALLAIGVLCDDRTLFGGAIDYFKSGLGNGAIAQTVYYVHPGYLGQTQESGRDQGHNTLSMALLTTFAEMAWNQGTDLYGYDNNRILAACEYVAKGNLIQSGTTYYTMPFATYTNGSVTDTAFSTSAQGSIRPEWALIFNHYVNRQGLAAPFTQRFMTQTQPEGGGGNYGPNSGGYDQLGYGTLTHTRDPIATGAKPSGLTAHASQGSVILSWWGTAYASSYNVKRSSTAGGPYTNIAMGITDPLTYTDGAPGPGPLYYVVTAMTPAGETAASNEARGYGTTQQQTYLAFDEGSGTTATDGSGNAHTATLLGGATWTAGRTGSAVLLNGTSAYVSLPDDIMVDFGDFTIAAWVYWKASGNSQRIFDFGSGTGHYMFLTPRDGSSTIRFAITTNLSVGEQNIKGTAALPTGQWVRVAVTLSGTTGTLYVNGVAVGTNAAMQLTPLQLGHTHQNWIGRSQYAADPYFNGLVDDFRIYYGELSAAQIAAL